MALFLLALTQAYNNIICLNNELICTNKAYEKYFPREYLNLLDNKNISYIDVGNNNQKEMTILYSDIHLLTIMMTPDDIIKFINSLFSLVGPLIRKHNGFIMMYNPYAIIACFPDGVDDAVQSALEVKQQLECRHYQGICIGIHSGVFYFGVVDDPPRMNVAVLSSVFYIASKVESYAKEWTTHILMTEYSYQKIINPAKYSIQLLHSNEIENLARIYMVDRVVF